MTQAMPDDLWRDFPKTATAFEARFATEEDCRAYWIAARWGGEPSCARCNSTRVWTIREGTTFECADCGHQTSLTSGTLLEKTHKPLKVCTARSSRSPHAAPVFRPRTCSGSWASAPTRRRGPGCTSICGYVNRSFERAGFTGVLQPDCTRDFWIGLRAVQRGLSGSASGPD
jgi:Transposase zinc-ribbon domain